MGNATKHKQVMKIGYFMTLFLWSFALDNPGETELERRKRLADEGYG